jgi:hypothetical protein
MRAALLKRLQRLEEVRGVVCQPPEFQVGYVKELPADYIGERHLVTVGRDLDGLYHWESRPGPDPDESQGNLPPFRVILAPPDDEPPALGRAKLDAD